MNSQYANSQETIWHIPEVSLSHQKQTSIMSQNKIIQNQQNNIDYYDREYSAFDYKRYQYLIENFDIEFNRIRNTHSSFHHLYTSEFIEGIRGKNILEIGAGDCYNALIMSLLGANVYVNDISEGTRKIAALINNSFILEKPLKVVNENLLTLEQDRAYVDFFDFVVGIAIIHHLDEILEEQIYVSLKKVAKPDGKFVFFEPAHNSHTLYFLKMLFKSDSGRPSILKYASYKKYKENDPHPERDNSSKRYSSVGIKYFGKFDIQESGFIYQIIKFIPVKIRKKYLAKILRIDDILFSKWYLLPVFGFFARNIKVTYYKSSSKI